MPNYSLNMPMPRLRGCQHTLKLLLMATISATSNMVFAGGAIASAADASSMIQYNIQVEPGDDFGDGNVSSGAMLLEMTPSLQEASEAYSLVMTQQALAAAAAARVEITRLSAAVEALATQASCARAAKDMMPRVTSLLATMSQTRVELENIMMNSPSCSEIADADVYNGDTLSDDKPLMPQATLPDTAKASQSAFSQWHTAHFSKGFGLEWSEIANKGRRTAEIAALNLQQRRACSDGDSDQVGEGMPPVLRGPAGYSFQQLHSGDVPLNGMNAGFGGSTHSSFSGSDGSDGAITGGLASVTGANHTHSKWDEIMRNGFKQMSNMMKPKDPLKPRSWVLLVVFLFLALLVLAAILFISMPLVNSATSAPVPTDGSAKYNFVQVALPYWMPTDASSRGIGFVIIFCTVIISALCINFWVGFLAYSIIKHTDSKLASQVSKAKIFNSEILQIISIIGVTFAPIAFFVRRKDLDGRWRQWKYVSIKMFLVFEGQLLSIVGGYSMRMQMNHVAGMDADGFWHIVRTLQMGMMIVGIFDSFAAGYIDQILMLDWRKYLTEHVLEKYMGGQAYYKMNSNSGKDDGADNPDQRMQGDVDNFVQALNTFVFSIINTVITLISATIIVWTIMPKITIILLCYCSAGSLIALYFTWNFVKLNYRIQKLEADYRYSMVHIRDNAEGIAFYGGENQGKGEVNERFHELLYTKYQLIIWDMSFGAYNFLYVSCGDVMPMILLARKLFHGAIDFGAMGQVGGNFANVMNSLSFINKSTHLLANLGTSTARLAGLLNVIDQVQKGEEIVFETSQDNTVRIQDVCVQTPDGRDLVQKLTIHFEPRKAARLLVVGRSGVGKSSLMRTLAGVWSQGKGLISMPPKKECMFLPQKPYMPLGTLRKQLCYPSQGNGSNDSDLRSMLEELGLGDLPDRFEEGFEAVREWPRVLSLGEQQRVATIRAMIHAPSMVVLDESTSALSMLDENLVYNRFIALGMSFISVGHRMSIVKFHDRVLELKEGKGSYELHTRAQYQQIVDKGEH